MGRARFLITDVTRMSGDQVCVAGLDPSGRSVRPVLDSRRNHARADLRLQDGTVVRPRGLLTALVKPLSRLRPPHLEDVAYQRASATVGRAISHAQFLQRLEKCCDRGVRYVFGKNLQGEPKAYLLPDRGERSLATVRALAPLFISLEERDGRLKPRVTFRTAGEDVTWEHDETSDWNAVQSGYVSLTPLTLELTDYREMVELESMGLTLDESA